MLPSTVPCQGTDSGKDENMKVMFPRFHLTSSGNSQSPPKALIFPLHARGGG